MIATACNRQITTSTKKSTQNTKEVSSEKETTNMQDLSSTLIVVLNNANEIENAKSLITNSGLTWQSVVINKENFKAALIKVPTDKKEFWLNRLKSDNTFYSVDENKKETLQNIVSISDNTIVKIRKTACRGYCPVFTAFLLNDGTLVFNGLKNTLIEGKREVVISKLEVGEIKKMFEAVTVSSLNQNFTNANLMDVPSTFINYREHQIEIQVWKNVPSKLKNAYDSFEKILKEQKMIK